MRTAGKRSVAYVRGQRFEIGAPVEFDEDAPTVSALEYALGALAADLAATFSALARRRRLQLDGVESVVTGELNNPLTVLQVVGETGHPGLERIRLKLYVASAEPEDVLIRLWEEAQALSPLARTFAALSVTDLEFHITP